MKTRILSAVIMLPLLILLFVGGKFLLLACFVIGVMGVREFYHGFENLGIKPSYTAAYISSLGLYAVNLFAPAEYHYYMFWLAAVLIMSMLYLFDIEKRELADSMATLTGIIYAIFLSFHVTLVEQTGEYGILVWLIFITAFGTDSMAYFTGLLIGKHKLAPKISPKKTIEGAVGGIIGSVLFCILFGYFAIPRLLAHCAVIGILGGFVSQLGDLSASIFKRKMGIKDYGNLIPGHGGILDRIDSVLFTAPLVYYYVMIVLE
jgi:phosphatidate cytidylyltransferase